MTGLTCIGGFIRIPFIPVPMTLQTLFVYLSGTLLGPGPGCVSQIIYLLIGFAGVPVFTSGGGPAYVLHPTFGYLLGFPIAAWVSGRMARRVKGNQDKYTQILFCLTAGMSIILGLGILGLTVHLRWIEGKTLNVMHVLWAGALIFIPAELFKILLAAQLILRFRPLMEHNKL
ncbi:biotin transporter BioY [bacterium]|nr:biotin transporter BioY [bacterium]